VIKRRAALLSFTLLLLSDFLVAHHSMSKEFDETKEVQIEGRVTRVDWTNPHAQVFLQVPSSQGKGTSTVWTVQLANPGKLIELGWSYDTVHAGTTLRVRGTPALDRSSKMFGWVVTIVPNGKTFDMPETWGHSPIRTK
jgi:hypothetical protein